jgi:hypothetical protein
MLLVSPAGTQIQVPTCFVHQKNFYAIVKERKLFRHELHGSMKLHQMTGGGERDRTDDLLLARQALSQLSYTPVKIWWAREDLNLRPHDYQSCALAS